MNTLAIAADRLGKRYRLGEHRSATDLREYLTGMTRRTWSGLWAKSRGAQSRSVHDDRSLWALRDVSFEVRHGEVLGILGENGSGKTTLLSLLAQITRPTAGRADLFGRVGTVLDAGAGFHSELTGRENLYLKSALLSMSASDLRLRLEQIVDFAGLARFIDTPLKRYSSGMCARLAFSLAVHVNCEILLVDEVLATADQPFQRKCLENLHQAAGEGRTVLLVSQDRVGLREFCKRGIVLAEGHIVFDGRIDEAAEFYCRIRNVRHDRPVPA